MVERVVRDYSLELRVSWGMGLRLRVRAQVHPGNGESGFQKVAVARRHPAAWTRLEAGSEGGLGLGNWT